MKEKFAVNEVNGNWRKVFVTKLQYHLFVNRENVIYNKSITNRL